MTGPIGIMGSNRLAWLVSGSLCMCCSKKEGQSMNRRDLFVLFSSITLKHLEFQSSSREPQIPIILIAIAAYTFTL